MQHKVLKKYNGDKKEEIYHRWSIVICIRTGIRIWEDSEDEDYAPEVYADRLEEDVELHAEREENTEASDVNKGGWGEPKMIMMLNILQVLMVMMQMVK